MLSRKIIYVSISIILVILLVGTAYFVGTRKNLFLQRTASLEVTFSPSMEAGTVGEVMVKEETTEKEAPLVSPTMPPAIFGTAGIVRKIESDCVIVQSNGTHFADGVARDVTAVFTSETSTFVSGQAFKWQGFFGLEQLEPGMKILIESQENIRGKTEFEVKTINIL